MLYLAVSHFGAVEHDARSQIVNQFGWHEATARPRRWPSLRARLGFGDHAGWDVRSTYVFRPLETISV
jgi:hypothetical protein